MSETVIRGFVRSAELSNNDHGFAAHLRSRNAIDNRHETSGSVEWYTPTGRIVAVAIYDNTACTYNVWLPVLP